MSCFCMQAAIHNTSLPLYAPHTIILNRFFVKLTKNAQKGATATKQQRCDTLNAAAYNVTKHLFDQYIAQCLKNRQQVSFYNNASEASNVYFQIMHL